MGALDCVNKISATESTEIFTVPMASTTTLNEPVSFDCCFMQVVFTRVHFNSFPCELIIKM